jgi:hypothetical protein
MPNIFSIGITVAGQLPIYTEFPDSETIGVTNINYVKERAY